ncbi:MAG: hypothetical protein WC584_02565 [Candidatus Pacearchaeota archaeon]
MIILFGLMILEALVIIFLFAIIRNSSRNKKTIKEKLKELKSEHYVIVFLYIVLFAVIGYFLIANLFPDNPINNFGNYEISASDVLMTSELRSLYLDKDVFGGKTEINNESARMIVSAEPFNVVFNPKKIIAENTTAELQLSFLKPETEVYLNDKLIIPNLNNYEKVQEFSDTEVWVKNTLTIENYQTSDNAENFVYSNFPLQSVYSFVGFSGGVPLIQGYNKNKTRIETQFRDNLKLAVYAEGTLEIKFTKQDLNSYIGNDEYTVEIIDYQRKSHFNKVYKDDEENKDTGKQGEEQYFEIKLDNLPRNIYYITFTKDKYNKSADSTIKDIKINSNKVLILGNSLPWSNFNFYTKVDSPKTIGFMYWWKGKEQKIEQTGIKEDTIDLDKDWLNKKYEQKLTEKGDYNFEIDKGYLWIYSDAISLDKGGWFYLPKNADKKLIDSDVIIIDKTKLEIDGDNVSYKERVEINEGSKFKIQVLDEAKIYFGKAKIILESYNETAIA